MCPAEVKLADYEGKPYTVVAVGDYIVATRNLIKQLQDTIAEIAPHVEALAKMILSGEKELKQRDAIDRVLAASVISSHKCSLFGTGQDAVRCIVELYEACRYGSPGDCIHFGLCTCEACQAARVILEHKPE